MLKSELYRLAQGSNMGMMEKACEPPILGSIRDVVRNQDAKKINLAEVERLITALNDESEQTHLKVTLSVELEGPAMTAKDLIDQVLGGVDKNHLDQMTEGEIDDLRKQANEIASEGYRPTEQFSVRCSIPAVVVRNAACQFREHMPAADPLAVVAELHRVAHELECDAAGEKDED